MNTLTSIEVDLPKRRLLKVEALNRRFVKLGFTKLESLKRDSLPIIDNSSVMKRYKTERSEEKYVNQFCEFNYDEEQGSNLSLKTKKSIQPLCIYKKPKIRDNFFSYRKRILPKMSDKRLPEETAENEFMEKEECESPSKDLRASNQSLCFAENELITFYPSRIKPKY